MKETAIKGFIGSVVPIGAAIVTPQVEAWLRCTSLAIGILVGLVTLIGLFRRWNK